MSYEMPDFLRDDFNERLRKFLKKEMKENYSQDLFNYYIEADYNPISEQTDICIRFTTKTDFTLKQNN